MTNDTCQPPLFVERFISRKQAEHYRDRYRTGRHAGIHRLEQAALRKLLGSLDPIETAMDLPCGTGRLSGVLADVADRVVLADASGMMIELAREEMAGRNVDCCLTTAEAITMPSASADLIFCHRLFNHIPDLETRARIFREFARVSRQYVVLSSYPSGLRTKFRRLMRRIFQPSRKPSVSGSASEVIMMAAGAGLKLISRCTIRRFPVRAEFLLFTRHQEDSRHQEHSGSAAGNCTT